MNTASAERIGLDLGTSAIKGAVVGSDGRGRHTAEQPVRYTRPRAGWVEADAEAWFEDVCIVLRHLAAAAGEPVRALAMAAASGNTLLADVDGRPLTPILNWMDRRACGAGLKALSGLTPAGVRQVVGWPCVETFPLAHLAWLREHRPALHARAAHVCMNTDWLLFRLTGRWIMDHSTATTFHLQDQVRRCWHRPFLDRLGIAESQLSTLTGSGARIGRITAEAARATGLPDDLEVFTGCFDHPAAARAVGVTRPGDLLLSCGTSWVGFFPEPDRQRIVDAELLCDPFLSETGGPWGAMFSVPCIGQTVDAYVREIIAPGEASPYAVFEELAVAAPAGAGGLIIDLREPARPIAAPRANLARAVMEGAARLITDRMHELRLAGFRFERAVLTGGPSRSPTWAVIIREAAELDLGIGDPFAGAVGAAVNIQCPMKGESADENGDDSGRRLESSPLANRSRRRSRRPKEQGNEQKGINHP